MSTDASNVSVTLSTVTQHVSTSQPSDVTDSSLTSSSSSSSSSLSSLSSPAATQQATVSPSPTSKYWGVAVSTFTRSLLLNNVGINTYVLPRDAMHKRGLCRRALFVCSSVRPSITFVYCVERSRHVFEFFSPSASQQYHSSFSVPNVMALFRRGPALTRASNASGGDKNRDSRPLSGFIACGQRLRFDRQVQYTQLHWTAASW